MHIITYTRYYEQRRRIQSRRNQELYKTRIYHIVFSLLEEIQQQVLWDTLDMDNFYFLFLLFSDFIGILFFFFFLFSDNEEAHDIAVTWHVTWCDVISLEYSRKILKMMSGHIYATWWPWVENEVDMMLI